MNWEVRKRPGGWRVFDGVGDVIASTDKAEVADLIAAAPLLLAALKGALANASPLPAELGPNLSRAEDVWPDWVGPARAAVDAAQFGADFDPASVESLVVFPPGAVSPYWQYKVFGAIDYKGGGDLPASFDAAQVARLLLGRFPKARLSIERGS